MTAFPNWSASNQQMVSSVLDQYIASYGLPSEVMYGLVAQESGFNPNATGTSGDTGLTQILLSTARGMGFTGTQSQLYDPDTNVRLGFGYFAGLLSRFGDVSVALSAYNGGYRNGVITNPAYVNGVLSRANYFASLFDGSVSGDDASMDPNADSFGPGVPPSGANATVAAVGMLAVGGYFAYKLLS